MCGKLENNLIRLIKAIREAIKIVANQGLEPRTQGL
jgi:hypothetical protein